MPRRKFGGAEPEPEPKKPKPATSPEAVRTLAAAPEPTAPATITSTRAVERFADQVMVGAQRTAEIFRDSVTNTSVYHAPDTTMWTAGVQNNAVLTAATDESLRFFASIYGSEDLAAFMSAELLEDDAVRERTYAALASLRGKNYSLPAPGSRYGTVPSFAEGATSASPQELMEQVLADPSSLESMSALDKAKIAGIADELLGSLEELPDTGISEAFKRAVAIAASGDVSLALDEGEIAVLGQLRFLTSTITPGFTKETLELPGGGPFLAENLGIEQIRALGEGVIVLDLDWAKSAPDEAFAIKQWLEQNNPEIDVQFGRQGVFGSVLDVFGRAVDYVTAPVGAALVQVAELGERLGRSPEDKRKALAAADALEKKLQSGGLTGEAADKAMRDIVHLRDEGTDEVGWGAFSEQVVRNVSPRNIGFGFADSYTKSVDLVPGDPGYGPVYAVSGLMANIVADPLNFLIPGIGAVKAARHIPKFRRIEQALASVEEVADGLMLANPALRKTQALRAAERLAGEASGDLFPMVGRSWLKNAAYRRLAKYPEELAVTKPFMKAQERLWRLRSKLGKEEFSAALGMYGLDTDVARYLAQTNSLEDMQTAMVRAMTGVGQPALNANRYVSRLDRVTRQLDEAASPSEISSTDVSNVLNQKEIGYSFQEPSGILPSTLEGGQRSSPVVRSMSPVSSSLQNLIIDAPFPGQLIATNRVAQAPRTQARLQEALLGLFDEAAIDPARIKDPSRLAAKVAERQAKQVAEYGRTTYTADDVSDIVAARVTVPTLNDIAPAIERLRSVGRIEKVKDYVTSFHESGYVGVNVHLRLPDGHLVEVQFHTPRTLPAAQFNHPIYEQYRTMDKTTEEARRLADQMRERSAQGLADELNLMPDPGLPPGQYADLIAERAWLVDTIKGRDWVQPMTQVFSAKQLRRLERLSGKPLGVHGRVIAAMTDFTEHFPSNVIGNFGARQYRDPAVVKSAERVMAELGNMYRKTGAGEVLSFPHTSKFAKAMRGVRGEILDDAVNQSLESVVNIARFMGIPNKRIRALMAPWTAGELSSARRSFEWWKSTWETIVDESPKLTGTGKAELRQMWRSFISERSPGYISTETVGGLKAYEPTLYRKITDETTGEVIQQGIPAFEADQFQTWRTPGIEDLRAHMTLVQRHMNDWRTAGGAGKRALSLTHLGLSQLWTGINSAWRTTTLGFRLFGALPARIGMEQMVRIAAFDYASAVWHPAEWFASTRLGTRILSHSDAALFSDSPIHALGTLINDVETHPNFTLARAGRETVTLADGLPYYRAYSERLSRMYASPSVHEWHLPHLDDVEGTLAGMRRRADGEEWLAQYAEIGMDPAEAVTRTQAELKQMIGTGPGADLVRTAMNRGAAVIDGDEVRVGTSDFAEALERMAARGDWKPAATFLARSAGDYLPVGRVKALSTFRDNLFRWFYAAPDLATARSPLYRQMAARQYRNLIRRGYKPENALRLARAHAARGTADLMFTIGAKTSGEYFLRNINPFFPAFRELATTWLKRIPLRVGEGHWALGSAAVIRRADVWMDFFKNLGVVRTDERGKLYVPIPGLDKAVALLTGADVGFDVRAPLETFAGILPVPLGVFEEDENGNPLPWYKRLRGVLPTLGGPASAALGLTRKAFGGALEDIENWVTLYGTDNSLGPLAVDRFFEAFGITMPWMTGTTRDYHEAVRTWAVIDGMRMAWAEHPAPNWQTFDANNDGDLTPEEQAAFGAAHKKWADDLMKQGERYAMGTYLLRAVGGMTLPFSIQIADEGKQKMKALWGLLNVLPEEAGGGGLSSALIDSVLTSYPELESYMTGKTQDTRLIDDPDESLDEFMQAVKEGKIKIRSAQDWTIFAYGMNSYQLYQARRDAVYAEAGDSPAEWLVNFDAKEELEAESLKWEDFLDLSEVRENWLPGQTQSFRDMFETYQGYQRIRRGEEPVLSIEQQQLLDFDRAMDEYATYFSSNPDSSDDYFKLRDAAFESLKGTQSDLAKGVSWWFENVNEPYWTAADKLYKELDRTPDRDKALVFQKIRDLSAEYDKPWKHPEYGDFPAPEEYLFLKKSEDDQRQAIAEWANFPSNFLTEFQREKVGYSIPEAKQDEADKLAALMTKWDHRFNKAVVKNDLSFSSTSVQDARDRLDAFYGDKARESGLGTYWRELNQPEYRRIGSALELGKRTSSWTQVSSQADQLRRAIESVGYSPAGTSDAAIIAHKWLVERVASVRKNDSEFDAIMDELSVALGEEGKPLADDDLVLKLFFGVFSTSQAYYLD